MHLYFSNCISIILYYCYANSFSNFIVDYSTWKNAIVAASLTTPSSIERLLSKDSSTIPNSDKISGDSFDRDDVFHCDSSLTTIDVTSDRFIDSKINHIRRAYSAGGIDRLRSLHQGYLVRI